MKINNSKSRDWARAESRSSSSSWLSQPLQDPHKELDLLWTRRNRQAAHSFQEENRAIDSAIEQSRFILAINLEEDDFIPYAISTWERAVSYLRRMALRADMKSYDLPIPKIVPADSGSIDLLWKIGRRSLLINFPSDGDFATFAGRKAEIHTSGVLLTDDAREELIRWLCS